MSLKSTILAIGTEITDGQILNKNAQWIAQQLEPLGLNAILHISVPDDEPLMIKALEQAFDTTDLIFLSGGLGPTSDDFTRDVLARFFKRPLELNDTVWQQIQDKLNSRQVPIRQGHKNQALFPQEAHVLANNVGVAPGFYLTCQNKKIWVLPGPPIELQSIWKEHIHNQLKSFTPSTHEHLYTWLVLDAAESEVAQITENHFAKARFAKKLGYRLATPYVEVKLWTTDKLQQHDLFLKQFEDQLGASFIGHSLNEIYQPFTNWLQAITSLSIFDGTTDGILLEKLKNLGQENLIPLKKIKITTLFSDSNIHELTQTDESQYVFTLNYTPTGDLEVTLKYKDDLRRMEIPLYKKRTSNYLKSYITEKFLLLAPSMASIIN